MTEHTTQTAIVRYLETVLPNTYRVVHVANNPRSRVSGALEKARGAKKGFPDLIIIGPADRGCAFLEVKKEGQYLRPEQKEWRDWLSGSGHEYAVVRSIEDVRETLVAWNVSTREAA